LNILILTGREQGGCDQILEVGTDGALEQLKGIAEEAEGVELDWLTYPPLPGSEFAISTLYPKKVYNIFPWSVLLPFVGAKIYKSDTQSLINTGLFGITFNQVDYNQGMTTSTGITVITAGQYRASAGVGFATGGGLRVVDILKNGARASGSTTGTPGLASQAPTANVQAVWEGALAVGDIISVRAMQNSGGNINTVAGIDSTWLAVSKIG
jgi:hypothetical protein